MKHFAVVLCLLVVRACNASYLLTEYITKKKECFIRPSCLIYNRGTEL